jgi:HEAT repeat protein
MRVSKKSILSCLEKEPLDAVLAAVRQWPPRRMVSPLIGCLFHGDERIKWHAVSALGAVVADLAESDREAARTVIRRLMWSLNDESGSIGWGAPETLAEIMAGHEGLAGEYGPILVSYMRPGGCYLELPTLQRGLMWGMGRMAGARPGLLKEADAPALLPPYLDSEDAEVRGLAARALGLLRVETARGRLASLGGDTAEFLLYDRGELATVTVGGLASAALALIG